jgi:hypothetical protein
MAEWSARQELGVADLGDVFCVKLCFVERKGSRRITPDTSPNRSFAVGNHDINLDDEIVYMG